MAPLWWICSIILGCSWQVRASIRTGLLSVNSWMFALGGAGGGSTSGASFLLSFVILEFKEHKYYVGNLEIGAVWESPELMNDLLVGRSEPQLAAHLWVLFTGI